MQGISKNASATLYPSPEDFFVYATNGSLRLETVHSRRKSLFFDILRHPMAVLVSLCRKSRECQEATRLPYVLILMAVSQC